MNNRRINVAFQQVFFTVVILTTLSGSTSLWLASSHDTLSEHQDRLFETSSSTWQMGVGAVFGLLGGKATELFQTNPEDSEESDESE